MVTFTWHACNLYKVYQLRQRFILLVLLGGGGGGGGGYLFIYNFWLVLVCFAFWRVFFCFFVFLSAGCTLDLLTWIQQQCFSTSIAKLPFSKTMELPELRVFINSLQLRHCFCYFCLSFSSFLFKGKWEIYTHYKWHHTQRKEGVLCLSACLSIRVFQRGDLIFISF